MGGTGILVATLKNSTGVGVRGRGVGNLRKDAFKGFTATDDAIIQIP